MVELNPAPGRLAEGSRIYAVGDVHGCLPQLGQLHDAIARDLAERPVARSVLIHLGDYVDRGPDSAGVLRRLARGQVPAVTARADLMGNHETMMLDCLARGQGAVCRHWLANGGDATLDSFAAGGSRAAGWRDAIDADCLDWLEARPLSHREGGYVFVHAGIRPGRALDAQTEEDLLWIREPFLSDPEPRDFVVVHGHTPRAAPEIRANRIGIDTGAVLGGRLSCLVLEGDRLGLMQA